MAYNFTETLTIELPKISDHIAAFEEAEYKSDHGLIVEVAAIHVGMTANFNNYSEESLEESLQSWVSPYPKPIILNHDLLSDPIGRVMAAKMEQESDGTPYTQLRVAVLNPEAISRVLDQRYLTGSVGGRAKEARCSVCGVDWAEANIFELPCKHRKGKTYKGKLAYMEMKSIEFKEYSFVNAPADSNSKIKTISVNSAEDAFDDGWVKSARMFSIDMNNEAVHELSESGSVNILESVRKKDVSPYYMYLKGDFLSALAATELEKDETTQASEEELIDMSKENVAEEEDILEVTDSLSSDLAETSDDEAEEIVSEEAEDETPVEEEGETAEDVTEEETSQDASVEEEEEKESDVEEDDKRPEGQEHPRTSDVDPETSAGAPVSRESDEDEGEEVTEQEEEETSEEEVSESDLSEAFKALESRVEELTARESTLLEENAKLKAALKRNLAERVVDTKIMVGIEEADDRDELLDDHVKRSASSLADSLRDLAKMPKSAITFSGIPNAEGKTGAVDDDSDQVITSEEEEDNEDNNKAPTAEDGLHFLLNRTVLEKN